MKQSNSRTLEDSLKQTDVYNSSKTFVNVADFNGTNKTNFKEESLSAAVFKNVICFVEIQDSHAVLAQLERKSVCTNCQ